MRMGSIMDLICRCVIHYCLNYWGSKGFFFDIVKGFSGQGKSAKVSDNSILFLSYTVFVMVVICVINMLALLHSL